MSFTRGYHVADRFWVRVDVRGATECWNWLRGKSDTGYGAMKLRGVMTGAHRIAWMLTNGEVPENAHVLHRCDNRACVNPSHLFLGDQKLNMLDMNIKERHPRRRLLKKDVMAIRKSSARTVLLARRYNVGVCHIRQIKRRVTWTWLEE